jgi:hypothetical protein
MSLPDYEALSRLLDGELDPDAANALRARIASEPDLREAWEMMTALPAAIAELPQPAFSSEWADLALVQRPSVRSLGSWIGWGVAAAALLLHLLPAPAPVVVGPGSSVTLLNGVVSAAGQTLVVEGQARVQVSEVGDLTVAVTRGWARLDDRELAEGEHWPPEVEEPVEYAHEVRVPLFASAELEPLRPPFVAPITSPHPNYEKTSEFRQLIRQREEF